MRPADCLWCLDPDNERKFPRVVTMERLGDTRTPSSTASASSSWRRLARPSSNSPRARAFLAEQLRKNTSSATHNFAEGYCHRSKGEQRRYFGYAIQSARESSASFDTARAFVLCRDDTIIRGKALALDIVKILSKWGC